MSVWPKMEPRELKNIELCINSAWAFIVGKNYETLSVPVAKLMYMLQCFPGLHGSTRMLSVTSTETKLNVPETIQHLVFHITRL